MDDRPATTFGVKLRELRRAHGYSLRTFERASHHSKSLIGQWELGQKIPPPDVVEELDFLLRADGQLVAAADHGQPDGPPDRAPSEVYRRYAHQGPVADEIRRRAAAADQIDVLAVRGLGLLGLNDSVLRPSITGRTAPLLARVLLVDPDSEAAARRAGEIGESPAAFTAGIKLTLARLEELAAAEPGLTIEVRLYDRVPIWRIIRIDDTMWVSTFAAGWEGHESSIYELAESPRGALWAGYRRTFEDLAEHARRVI